MAEEESATLARPARTRQELREAAERARVAAEDGGGEERLRRLLDAAECLPAALRAAYQVDVARARLQAGDPTAAGRAVLEADRTATAEVRARPAVREVLGAILRACGQPEPPVARLAEALDVKV